MTLYQRCQIAGNKNEYIISDIIFNIVIYFDVNLVNSCQETGEFYKATWQFRAVSDVFFLTITV